MAANDEPKITIGTIKQCAPTICQYMNRQSLAPYLLQCSLLTNEEMCHFLDSSKSQGESSNYLINIIETKHPDGAQMFYECLQTVTGHLQIVKELKSAAMQDSSSKDVKEIHYNNKEKGNLVKPNELKAMVHKKLCKDITSDSDEATICRRKTQILLVTASEFEQFAVLSLLEPMEGTTALLSFQYRKSSSLALVATYTIGKFGAFNAGVQRMTTQGPTAAQDVISITSDCFGHNLNAIFAVGVACGIEKKNNLLDVLISSRVTFYTLARFDNTKGEKPKIISREIANLPASNFLLQYFNSLPEWPAMNSKIAARLTRKPQKQIGVLLSGDYLVDNKKVKDKLLNNCAREAIGIEMEGAGLYHDYRSHPYEMLIVKSVCDFGDGKKNKEYQPTAALLAAECLHHYLSSDTLPKSLSDLVFKKKDNLRMYAC